MVTDNSTEKEVVAEVKTILVDLGFMKINEKLPGPPSQIQRINTGAFKVDKRFVRSANPGTLDFEGYDNKGRMLGIECKRRSGGKLSPEQKARIDDINKKGGIAFVVHSGQETIMQLRKHGCI